MYVTSCYAIVCGLTSHAKPSKTVETTCVSQRFETFKDGRTFTKTKSKGRLSIASTDSTWDVGRAWLTASFQLSLGHFQSTCKGCLGRLVSHLLHQKMLRTPQDP